MKRGREKGRGSVVEGVVGQNGEKCRDNALSTQRRAWAWLRDVAAVGTLGDTTATDARKGVRAVAHVIDRYTAER